MKVARIYLRVSTEEQDLQRQDRIVEETKKLNYYIAGVYREKASGTKADRPELLRMIEDLQPGEVVIAERIDRLSRLPLPEAEKLVASIRNKGARLAIPGLVDLSEFSENADGLAKVILESTQEMLLKVALQIAREEYEIRRSRANDGIKIAKEAGKYKGKKANTLTHQRILMARLAKNTINDTAKIAGCGRTLVKKVWKEYKESKAEKITI